MKKDRGSFAELSDAIMNLPLEKPAPRAGTLEISIEGMIFTINRNYLRGCLHWASISDGGLDENIADRKELQAILEHLDRDQQ